MIALSLEMASQRGSIDIEERGKSRQIIDYPTPEHGE